MQGRAEFFARAAVKQAEARASLTAGDVTRARDLENQRRERERQDQLQAMQKANAEAVGQAATAKQAVGAGLKNLASQAGAALGALVSEASPARHPGVAATGVQEYAPLPDEFVSSKR